MKQMTDQAEVFNEPEIVLFRGDREFIHKFQYEKTRTDAAYGRGIYLTNDAEMAATYRTKSNSLRGLNDYAKIQQARIIYSGEVISRDDALNKAFNNIRHRIDPYGNILVRPWRKRITLKHHQLILDLWQEIEPKLRIYKSSYQPSNVLYGYTQVKFYPEIVEVRYDNMPYIGRVTVFKFPRLELLNKTVEIYSGVFGHKVSEEIKTEYVGLRYIGGRIMGDREHQCFVIWDEDYVNKHRIRSIK